MQFINLSYVVNGLFFAVMGLMILAVGLLMFDKLTPGSFWKEIIDDQNIALGIMVGGLAIAISIVIAAAIN